ncbi:MAG: hypothetical protein ABR865_15345 [Terracidiphilus sp.]|jgi:hypothetical protein
MSEQVKFHELRLPCAGLRYVAYLGRRNGEFGFERAFNPFRETRILLPDGSKEEVHHLPDGDFVHEIQRVENGKLVYKYIATLKGDPALHPISRRGAEVFASRMQPMRQVIEEHPEVPPLEDYLEEDE